MYDLRDEFGVEIVNLNDEPREMITFRSGWRLHQLPLPTRLLHETDLLISMPVPNPLHDRIDPKLQESVGMYP